MPFKFMLMTLTLSPMRSFFGTLWFGTEAFFCSDIFCAALSILPRSLVRSFSISLTGAPALPYLLKLRIVSSATSLASFKILYACSFASRRILLRLESRRSCFCSSFSFKDSISALYWLISNCSRSIVLRLFSRSAIRSSKSPSLLLMRPLASVMRSDGRPSFSEMANALLLPGIPIKRR